MDFLAAYWSWAAIIILLIKLKNVPLMLGLVMGSWVHLRHGITVNLLVPLPSFFLFLENRCQKWVFTPVAPQRFSSLFYLLIWCLLIFQKVTCIVFIFMLICLFFLNSFICSWPSELCTCSLFSPRATCPVLSSWAFCCWTLLLMINQEVPLAAEKLKSTEIFFTYLF